jgi:nucleoside-diphosphate-sugar epimerase
LITGTTGLLGQYLLCESLEKRESTAVLARGQRGVSAAERVDRIVSLWEKRLGILLQRPVVLEGDLRFEGLQLSSADAEWFCHNVTSVLHNAASVRFQESPAGEPMKSNVDGTRNLLQLCRNSRVSEFHYVSTAYSCGQVEHSAPVLEKLHNEAGPFGNIYERSKCLSEHLVASFEGPFSRTIYRPSIIVGESTSGFAPSFNAIYTPLRLASIVITESPALVQSAEDLMNPIGVEGTEVRDLVPVDWVSQAITCTMRNPSAHGGIYHLTNQVQTAGQTIVTAMIQALAANANHASNSTKSADTSTSRMDLEAFRQHMETYSSYFQSDPQFDNS